MCIPSLHLDFISPCSRGVLKIREVTYHLFAFFTLYTSDHPLNPLSKTARSKDQCWRENKTSKHVLPMKHLQEERKWMMLEKVFGPPARVCLRSYAVLQFNVCVWHVAMAKKSISNLIEPSWDGFGPRSGAADIMKTTNNLGLCHYHADTLKPGTAGHRTHLL
jgi:hypothetical protein